MPGHPVAVPDLDRRAWQVDEVGSPFYLKTAGPRARSKFEVVSGHYDWPPGSLRFGPDC